MVDLYTVCVCSLVVNALNLLVSVYGLRNKNKQNNLKNEEQHSNEEVDVHVDLHNRLLQLQQQTYGRRYHTVHDDLSVMSMPRRRRK